MRKRGRGGGKLWWRGVRPGWDWGEVKEAPVALDSGGAPSQALMPKQWREETHLRVEVSSRSLLGQASSPSSRPRTRPLHPSTLSSTSPTPLTGGHHRPVQSGLPCAPDVAALPARKPS